MSNFNNKKGFIHTPNFGVSSQGERGFTLLIAIIVTGMLLIVSFAVVNVAVKQLVLANSNEESQHAFYAADSGTECAVYWDFRGGTSAFSNPSTAASINCGGSLTTTGNNTATTTFRVSYPKGCAEVRVGKHIIGSSVLTIIDSRGYNTCPGGARRLERAVKLNY